MVYYYNDKNYLCCENIILDDIVNEYKSPFYVYSKLEIVSKIKFLKDIFSDIKNFNIMYAVKAESNINILKIIIDAGCGVDVVSIWEIYRYLKAGGEAKNIVFSGVGKTSEEIESAMKLNIKCFNIESINEAIRINSIANKLNKKVNCSFRINPNVDALTHHKITTGIYGNKFGISVETFRENIDFIKSLNNLEVNTLSMHIGSQMLDFIPFIDAISVMRYFINEVRGYGFNIEHFDIGGGYGICYHKDNEKEIKTFNFDMFKSECVSILKDMNISIATEPGRFIVGEAGALISRVEYIKEELGRKYVILNSAMNDYMRVALYDSYNTILPLKRKDSFDTYDFAGPVCETTDFFAYNRKSYKLEEGDYVAIIDVGAYGASMSSNYNSRGLPIQVLIDNNSHKIIRKEQSFENLIDSELL